MTEDDLREMIRQRFSGRGDRKKFARQAGVSEARVSQFMRGHTGPGPSIVEALGLEICYREKVACTSALKAA